MGKIPSFPNMNNAGGPVLPGLDCGTCGFRTCAELAARLAAEPALLKRCLYLSEDRFDASSRTQPEAPIDSAITPAAFASPCESRTQAAGSALRRTGLRLMNLRPTCRDSLDREIDFISNIFPRIPDRGSIIPHNPMITREMDIQPGDILISRPLGMPCGCPITHCGIACDRQADGRVVAVRDRPYSIRGAKASRISG